MEHRRWCIIVVGGRRDSAATEVKQRTTRYMTFLFARLCWCDGLVVTAVVCVVYVLTFSLRALSRYEQFCLSVLYHVVELFALVPATVLFCSRRWMLAIKATIIPF